MKGNHIKKVLISAATIAACSILTALPVYADDTYSDDVWAYRAVANVVEAVNIRAAASEDSTIVGYLTTAASADVIERGETWSLVISGGVEGYVRNDCLAFGEDAKNLAGVYGSEGVKTYWDGVSLFAAPDGSSEVLATVSAGKEYEVLSNDGSWVEVQMDDATVAYVPAEDVMETTILDKAVSTGDAYGSVSGSSNSGSYDDGSSYSDSSYDSYDDGSSYSDNSYDTSYDSSYSDTSYDDGSSYTDSSYDTSYDDGSSYDTSYDNSYTDSSYDDGSSYTDSSSDTSYDDGSSYDSSSDTSYDDGSSYDSSSDTSYDDSSSSDTTDTSTSASSSDRELLAGLIYCEAGNQSWDGKVAVGAVVLNRVASSSFASTIKGVIYESGQFSPAGSGWLDSVIANGSIPSSCYDAADAALAGENPIGSAMYFNTGSGKGIKIGAHQFY
ncbi:cell wall hydrolase [Fusicatenibacter faecihominis]|uniref:Cell wall hydrolase n=1 Tax=Fusicatenibacter faecihominis TaxID=2881276 RepID=A0AAE3DS08_9FIRM|nr:cell wall hydrolase [Fusicatenibacter faecihominis]MCC2189355.1 cell wall hydrolase [Fusicatenibacter faecihominis]